MINESYSTIEIIRKLLTDTLTHKEIEIIKGRAGVDDSLDFSERYKKITLKKLGEKFGVGPTRIGQIDAKAMRKLRKAIPLNSPFSDSHNITGDLDRETIEDIKDKELRDFLMYVWDIYDRIVWSDPFDRN